MKICVLGGDGYCGWPTALYLSGKGHEVVIADNFARRRWGLELGVESLTPIKSLRKRTCVWADLTGQVVETFTGDVADNEFLSSLIRTFKPDAVVHLAEQRSAQYSMVDRNHAISTTANNVAGTLNLLFSLREFQPNCHLVRLGSLAEPDDRQINPEHLDNVVERKHCEKFDRARTYVNSFLDISVVHNSRNVAFACEAWGLRATDLNQGVVYGTATDEVALHPDLINRLDYDWMFGTVINRLCAQAAAGKSLALHGEGHRTWRFLDIRDTIRCIELACLCPAVAGEYRVFDQFSEEFSERELVAHVQAAAKKLGVFVGIDRCSDPKAEMQEVPSQYRGAEMLDLGFQSHLLSDSLIDSLMNMALQHRDRIDLTTLRNGLERYV